MADLNNVVDSLTEEIRDAARYAEQEIEKAISRAEDLVDSETDEDFWELIQDGDDEAEQTLRRLAQEISDLRYQAIADASRIFRNDGFDVYDSDLEASFNEDLENLEFHRDWDGLADMVKRY